MNKTNFENSIIRVFSNVVANNSKMDNVVVPGIELKLRQTVMREIHSLISSKRFKGIKKWIFEIRYL